MPDDLYDRDILAWSAQQAELLRRAALGERVNGVDWDHVIEEIEDVGISELNAVRSYLRQMLVHLLKLQGWPNSPSAAQWRVEIAAFQADAAQRFAPSMRQKIDLDKLYQRAVEQLEGVDYDGLQPLGWPAQCPCTLEQLLGERRAVLEQRFGAVV
jgi:Domain of unknown function DUF29